MVTGTESNIEIKRWVTESKLFTEDFPVFAILEDEEGNVVKQFKIIGCRTDGEKTHIKIKKQINRMKIISFEAAKALKAAGYSQDNKEQLYLLRDKVNLSCYGGELSANSYPKAPISLEVWPWLVENKKILFAITPVFGIIIRKNVVST